MIKEKKWIYSENKKEIPLDFVQTAGSKLLARLLVNRKIDTIKKAESFLNITDQELSSPYLFEHMEKAVEKINELIKNQEHIVIYGDFDSDGVTSTSLLYKTLRYLNANVSFYIPDRSEEGHGLNSAAVCRLISSKSAKLLITADCGISNLAEITLAKGLGVDVIITDHHEPPEIIPPAYAIINPKTIEEDSDLKYLAGVGVAFKVACALLESNNKSDFIDEILYLVAIGTIGDVVPLLAENRVLVYKGLDVLEKKKPYSLVKLLETAGFKSGNKISAEVISFSVVPRINAIGRLEKADIAVDLLVSEDESEIDDIVKKLNYNNRIRQQMCESAFVEANQKINKEIDLKKDKAIILADENWHPGIIGIVASKLVEKYYKPVFLISINGEEKKARCSSRGIEGFNLYDILSSIGDLFDQFGGHAFAAGFVLDLNKISFEKFRGLLNKAVNESSPVDALEPKIHIDLNLQPTDLTVDLIEEVSKLAPFGECNPAPIFSLKDITLRQFKTMGSNKNHLKLFFGEDDKNIIEGVWWQQASIDNNALDKVDVAFIPEVNHFGDKTRVQLIIKDIKTSSSMPAQVVSSLNQSDSQPQIVKWIDHRKRLDLEKSLSNYLLSTDAKVSVFAENTETVSILKNYPQMQERVFDRLNIPSASQLVIYDFPSDIKLFSQIVESTKPQMVHIVGKNIKHYDFKELIKTLSSMLKYAFKNKNGEINIDQIASLLDTSSIVINRSLDLLEKSKVIAIENNKNGVVQFAFLQSTDISTIMENIQEYNDCLEAINAVNEFRSQLTTFDLKDIKSMVDKINCMQLVV